MDVVGGYELEERVGSGSAGTVWRARSTDPLSRLVALKRVGGAHREGDASRLQREASILAELDHPHIVRVHGIVDDGDGIAIVMQYAPGGSLEQRLASRPIVGPSEAVAILAPVAEALASAHRAGVLHGDVKPGNILFTSDGEALLSDFGVAQWLSGPVTADHAPTGTAEYVAPEVLDGALPDARSDIYSLGIVAYELLAGRTPYAGPTALAVISAAESGDHVNLARAADDVPLALARVVERAIDRDPAKRPASAAELAARLRATVGVSESLVPGLDHQAPALAPPVGGTRLTQTFGPRPPAPAPPPEPPVWPRRLAAVGLVAAAGVVVAAGASVLFDDGPGPNASPTPTTVAAACPPVGDAPVPPGAVVLRGDTDGDGCEETVVWADRQEDGQTVKEVTISDESGVRFAPAGDAGDLATLGDWDCDGISTLGLYRPIDGRVFEFPNWPPPFAEDPADGSADDRIGPPVQPVDTELPLIEAEERPRARVGGRAARVVEGTDGCDEMLVE